MTHILPSSIWVALHKNRVVICRSTSHHFSGGSAPQPSNTSADFQLLLTPSAETTTMEGAAPSMPRATDKTKWNLMIAIIQLAWSDLIFHYGILRDDGVLCGKLESKSNKAWVAFGAQPEGKKSMVGDHAHAIIALPSDNTVQQYMLNSKSNSGINLFSEGAQTLTETSVTQDGGGTVARFKQPLDFNGLKLTSKKCTCWHLGTAMSCANTITRIGGLWLLILRRTLVLLQQAMSLIKTKISGGKQSIQSILLLSSKMSQEAGYEQLRR